MVDFSVKINEYSGRITKISFQKKKQNQKYTALEKQCKRQLEEYFSGKRKTFTVPMLIEGTDFQKNVWKEISKISYGKTASYKEIAARIGKPRAYRAVANACGANKLPVLIPCHRVVASNGRGGYSAGIDIKKKLLEIESRNK